MSREEPKKVLYDMGDLWKDNEGRTTTAFFGDFVVVNAYIPNGSNRLDFKMAYLDALTKHLQRLKKENTVICVGDFNIAHNEIDLTHPKQCASKSVFLPIERKAFEKPAEIHCCRGGSVSVYRDGNRRKLSVLQP